MAQALADGDALHWLCYWMNFARPTPVGGYTDTAGSACIKKISVLNGLPGRPNDKGDVQVMINLTSDSDALAGHH